MLPSLVLTSTTALALNGAYQTERPSYTAPWKAPCTTFATPLGHPEKDASLLGHPESVGNVRHRPAREVEPENDAARVLRKRGALFCPFERRCVLVAFFPVFGFFCVFSPLVFLGVLDLFAS
jgi:hypothetical protein